MNAWFALAPLPLYALSVALVNAATWRRGSLDTQARGSVSVLIPARNEERNIAKALLSIITDPHAKMVEEIVVCDDQSNDSTRSIVHELMKRDSRIRLLTGAPLRPGWVGKPHALSQLAAAARGDFFLFMDADVELKPGGISRLLSLTAAPAHGRVVTAMPAQRSGTFFERLVLPLLPLTYLAWLPLRLIEWGTDPRTVAANGQLLLLRRQDYRELGGFEAVRNQIVDDVAFCKHAKTNGKRVVFADGTLIAECRMYDGARATVDGFSKNIYEGVNGKIGVVSAMSLYFLTFLAPYLGVLLATLEPKAFEPLLLPALVGSTAILSLQLLLVARYQQPKSGLLFHPLSIVAFLAICVNSWRWHARGRVLWAGRSYPSMEARKRTVLPKTGAEHAVTARFEEPVR
jgi:chlorobactene glucosyltransferase